MTEEINKGCEFQSDCIEYKDMSYLKVMPICAIHELSIACHDKVNKCKYYKLYKQLKRLEQENKELEENQCHFSTCEHIDAEIARYAKLSKSFLNYRSALEEIREIAKFNQFYNPEYLLINGDIGRIQNLKMTEVYNKINEVLGDN